jgi:hypothetical protein
MLIAVMSTLVTGCSPSNVTGVGLSADGAPVLRNCGAWFRGVQVSDQQSGRAVWSAGKPDSATVFGVDEVQVGLLPGTDWVEQTSLTLEPRPAVWRCAIQFRDDEPRTIDVDDHDLAAGEVFLPGKSRHVSESAFRHDVCDFGRPVSLKVLLAGLAVAAVIGLAAAFFDRRRRRES